MGRWDFLEGVRPQTAADAVAAEAAKVLADELRRWPPAAVEWTDSATRERFAPLYAEGAPRPAQGAYTEAFRLARWELEHDVEAIDFYQRNDHAARALATAHDRLALELLWKLLTEWMYELAERTENRLKRRHLLACLDEAERRLLAA